MSIKDYIKDGKLVNFVEYRKDHLWYQTECGFDFPVPLSDTGDGVFKVQDKAITFMRYIRKHLDAIKQAQLELEK